MSEKVKLVLLFIIFIALVILTNNMLKDDENYKNTEAINSAAEEIVMQNKIENDTEVLEKVYTEVTESTFESEVLKSDKTVLVDFYADWCNPCKILSPILEEVARENQDIKLVKVNVDTNENLAYEYRAYSIPTLVVIKNGVEVTRGVGAMPKEDVLELIK